MEDACMSKGAVISILLLFLCAPCAFALVSVSHMGYHPQSMKSATVYTSATTGTYTVVSSTGTVVKSGALVRPTDFNGNPVNCQGNNPCLVADFTSVTTPGTYKVVTSFGNSSFFPVNANVYRVNAPVLNEYFDALAMKGSSYHADMNQFLDPGFQQMADGSFIMTADQAALTLMRLGSAYRKNPTVLSSDVRTFVKPNTPDAVEHMMLYVDFLAGLQDAKLQRRTDGVGFRVNAGVHIDAAFVPGPTSRTSIDIYDSGRHFIQTTPVTSMCGSLSGTAFNDCMAKAQNVYKCQASEPCLQISYIEQTATRIAGQTDGYGVDNGWYYEFACFYDVDVQNGNFNDKPNPCMIYDDKENEANTVEALLAYAEAIPVIYQYDQTKAQALLSRAVATAVYSRTNYNFNSSDQNAGYYGAANFILYDLTGNSTYLDEAYRIRDLVPQQFISDGTHSNEFYWEEYVRHKGAITGAGKTYPLGGNDPIEFFRGKMYGDYKDQGFRSIDRTGERVYQFDTNIQFQNSRFQLTEGLLAAKTKIYSDDTNPLIQTIADAQLAFLTGNNGVDLDQTDATDIQSMSFIAGIGNYPQQFHSRLQMNSGYKAATGGQVVGMRGNEFMWFDGTNYNFFDGKTTILGSELGSPGNGWGGETATTQLQPVTFKNGKTFIPGWISGVFDVGYDHDDIYDFRDIRGSYEFTESTNEIVASAIELMSYLDARYNNVQTLATPLMGNPAINTTTSPPPSNQTNTTNSTCYNSVQNIPVTCEGATITSDTWNGGRNIICGTTQVQAWDKTGFFEMYKQAGGNTIKICIGSTCISNSGYAKSGNFPICIGTTPPSNQTNTTTCTPSTEICDATDNNCNGQVDENNVCAPPSNSTCYNKVNDIPASCTGGAITTDNKAGCRTLICTNGGSSMQVLSCDKTGFFEMYKQSQTGTLVTKICIDSTCISNNGYAKSSNYPICTGTAPPPTCTPSTEVCDGSDNNCNGQIDENNVCAPVTQSVTVSIAPWYPKGRDYVFKCAANGFTATTYDWNFGNGNQQLGRTTNDVYYIYPAAGSYTVTCTAKGSITKTGNLAISVA
jgi:hypothetical protein